ncbi:uncharacterized protein LOC130667056 [Microplitis mediator]|uniref:uncharacterized protein LOC130667056 n=1 Tax=Microplitis mediator TaxID=375433 RepID=UPI0025552DF8|nr:uncharacterized protein LOC130667056 [Microplitis mediator]
MTIDKIIDKFQQQLSTDFPILRTMLEDLECHSDIAISRRIASNAISPELEESVNTAINIIIKSMGHQREKVRKLRKKFNRLVKGTLFINIINDIALKTEMEVELLESGSADSF